MEAIFYFLFALIGIITGWILRGCVDRRTDGQHGGVCFSGIGDSGESIRTIDQLEKTIEGAERANQAATQTIEKMQELLHSVRNGNDHTRDNNLPSS